MLPALVMAVLLPVTLPDAGFAPGRLTARPSYRPGDPARPTVCLVHGINSSSGGFQHLTPALEAAGFGVVLYDYAFEQALEPATDEFVRVWMQFRSQRGDRSRWAIVGHSMGALIARGYVEGAGYLDDVSHLVQIAPPNQGTALADMQALFRLLDALPAVHAGDRDIREIVGSGPGASAEDLMPGSPYLRALNARPRRAGVAYHILAGDAGFLSREDRRRFEARLAFIRERSGVVGAVLLAGLAGDLTARLDALSEGTGDGAVAVASTRLEGVPGHVTIHANHVELIRGPLLYPEPGPVACMPYLEAWLGALRVVGP